MLLWSQPYDLKQGNPLALLLEVAEDLPVHGKWGRNSLFSFVHSFGFPYETVLISACGVSHFDSSILPSHWGGSGWVVLGCQLQFKHSTGFSPHAHPTCHAEEEALSAQELSQDITSFVRLNVLTQSTPSASSSLPAERTAPF